MHYILGLTCGLLDSDPAYTISLCEHVLKKLNEDTALFHKITWTDEANSKQASLYWYTENGNFTIETQFKKTDVFGVLGPCI
jgi:hypothetical protein